MNRSRIEWCDHTWNPISGCRHGCPYCYARTHVKRFSGDVRLNMMAKSVLAKDFNKIWHACLVDISRNNLESNGKLKVEGWGSILSVRYL